MTRCLLIVQEIGVKTRRTEERPAIDVIDRRVESRRSIERVYEHVGQMAVQWTHLQMNGERRGNGAQIGKVQMDCLRMRDE